MGHPRFQHHLQVARHREYGELYTIVAFVPLNDLMDVFTTPPTLEVGKDNAARNGKATTCIMCMYYYH